MAEKRRRPENYLVGLLGHGVYGSVFMIHYNDSKYALKLLMQLESDFDKQESFRSTCDYVREIYGANRSGHLKALLGCPKTGRLGLLLPVFGDRLGNTSFQTYCPQAVAALLRPIADTLYSTPGMHRDVKLSNILMPSNQTQDATLIDFSLATNMSKCIDPNVITLWYRPPEVLMELEYTKKADIWSFGVVLFNLLCGTHLSRCATEENKHAYTLDILDKFGWPAEWPEFYKNLQKHFGKYTIRHGNHGPTYDFYAAMIQFPGAQPLACTIAADLLKKILKPNPIERIDWPEIFAHDFWTLADPHLKPFGHVIPDIKSSKECESFIEHAIEYSITDYGTIWSLVDEHYKNLIKTPNDINQELDIIDSITFFGRKLNISDSTIYYAYMIWRLARFKGVVWTGNEMPSACLLLACAFNEDIRATNTTWLKWFTIFEDSVDRIQKYPKTVMRILVFTHGHWPKKTFEQVYFNLSATCIKANLLDSTQILYKTIALFLLASRDYDCQESVAQVLQQVKGLVDAPIDLNTTFEEAKMASSLAIEMSDK